MEAPIDVLGDPVKYFVNGLFIPAMLALKLVMLQLELPFRLRYVVIVLHIGFVVSKSLVPHSVFLALLMLSLYLGVEELLHVLYEYMIHKSSTYI